MAELCEIVKHSKIFYMIVIFILFEIKRHVGAEDTSMKVSMYYSNLHYVEMLHED